MFKPFPDDFSYPALEHEILKFWDDNKVFERSLEERKDAEVFMFYEGPPTVNGRPGIHHVMGRTIKDMMCRYKTQRGYRVPRQAGWDTHGLPVELAVEKQLGLANKQEIDKLGVAKFNEACRAFVYANIEQNQGWRELTRRMGYWLDLDNPYITCTNEYVESVWWSLKQFFDKGLIYKSFRITPQSPTLETPLSSHELSLGYKDVRDPNCYVKLPVESSPLKTIEGAQILVWTTTPWTLISNTALAVSAELDYVLVLNKREMKQSSASGGDGKITTEDKLVLAEALLGKLDGEYEILAKFKGADFLGTRYEAPFPGMIPHTREEFSDLHTVLAGEFVSASDGSGVVHLAPAFGADDFEMSKKFNLPFFNPVSPGGRFTEKAGEFAGRTVKTFTYPDPATGGTRTEEGADKDLVIALKKADKIYRSTNDYLHSYPHCWRTGNPVIYYARESWFIKSSSYKEELVANNNIINWQPPEIGAGRFGNWLEEVKDWAISRDRYWGTPLPLWVAEGEGNEKDIFAVGSIEELKQGLYEHPDFQGGKRVPVAEALQSGIELDLHRPFADNVVFEKNGKTYRRVKEVIDVWYDSGAMPFAQLHYPFENKELFDKAFPAQFICEAVDQTRGWFYTLHNIATAVFGTPSFRNVIVNELILDKEGQKMSKSKGNVVDPFDVMEKYGADAVRWYFITNNPPWKPTLFNGDDIAKTVIADFFRSLTNTYAFFALYANIDGFTGVEAEIPFQERPEIDRWILSKLNSTLREYLRLMDEYEITRAMRLVQEFNINDVSNWYVRRNRRRFWKGEKDADKVAAYQTLQTVLQTLSSMIAPLAPFLAEVLYQRLTNLALNTQNSAFSSVHLAPMPVPLENQIDTALELRMEKAQNIVFLARSLREKSKIKTRQPLKRILVPVSSPDERRQIQSVQEIITEEINVKTVEYVSGETDIVRKSAKGNFKTLGKKFGKDTQSVANAIKDLTAAQIKELERTKTLTFGSNRTSLTIALDDVEIVNEDIEGWLVASGNGVTVALDTELDAALRSEGLAREFVSRIQNLRKDSGFEVTDRITLEVNVSSDIQSALETMRSYVQDETLCQSLAFSAQPLPTVLDFNEETISVTIQKV